MLSYKEIEVPDQSEFRNVSVVDILVKEGERIEVNSPLITVQSGEGTVDLPSPLAGKVQEVIVQIDDRISKGTSVLLLETEVEDPDDLDSPADTEPWAEAAEPSFSNLEDSPADELDGRIEPTLGYSAAEEDDQTNTIETAPAEPAEEPVSELDIHSTAADPGSDPKSGYRITVPDIGDFEEVEVIEVHVKAGDQIDVEDSLITLESDKATMDVPSPVAGTIEEVLVEVGSRVSEGSAIANLNPSNARLGPVVAEEESPVVEDPTTEEPAAEEPSAEQPVVEEPVVAAAPEPTVEDNTEADAAAEDVTAPSPTHEPEAIAADEDRTPPPGTPPADDAAPDQVDEVVISVPDIGDFDDVEVIEIHIETGQSIAAEDPLITLESDKATMDVPSPSAGVVRELFVATGDRVSEGSSIAALEIQAEEADLPTPNEISEVTSPEEPAREESVEAAPQPPAPKAAAAISSQPAPPPSLPPTMDSETAKPHASPAVRRFSRELGVDLTLVTGSGPKGRIVKKDVQQWVKKTLAEPRPAPTAEPTVVSAIPEIPEIDFSQFGEIEARPLGRIKKLTATNLSRAWLNVPHVTQHDEADITELEQFRQELKKEAVAKGEARITMLSFMMKACVVALKAFPDFNSSLEKGGANLILKKYYHLGIAVDTEDGLVVPVVRDVDLKTIRDLAAELDDISGRARNKKLGPKDLQGASFTISSLGGIGGTAFTPIVNAPEVAILGVSKSTMKPVYQDGDFVPRLILPLSLSYDHRVIDGAQAARFTSFLAKVLEDVRRLLL